MDSRAASFQIGNRLETESCADRSFDAGDLDSWMAAYVPCRLETQREWRQLACVFEWVVGCHEPPDTMKAQSVERKKARGFVPAMRRIKAASEQANPEARYKRREFVKMIGATDAFAMPGLEPGIQTRRPWVLDRRFFRGVAAGTGHGDGMLHAIPSALGSK
jgi:hypothetical protein